MGLISGGIRLGGEILKRVPKGDLLGSVAVSSALAAPGIINAFDSDRRLKEIVSAGEDAYGKHTFSDTDKFFNWATGGLTGINEEKADLLKAQQLKRQYGGRLKAADAEGTVLINSKSNPFDVEAAVLKAERKSNQNDAIELQARLRQEAFKDPQARYDRLEAERNRREDNNRFYQQQMNQMDMYRMGIEREDRRDRRDAKMQLVAALTGSLGNLGNAFLSI